MSDTDLAVTGKDAQIVFLQDGLPRLVHDVVVTHSAEPILSEIAQKHLGTSDVDVDIEHEGWKGELEVSVKDTTLDGIIDVTISKIRLRVAGVLNLVETTRYRDGTSRTYTYPDIKITGAPKSLKRSEASTMRMQWRTGKNRIAS